MACKLKINNKIISDIIGSEFNSYDEFKEKLINYLVTGNKIKYFGQRFALPRSRKQIEPDEVFFVKKLTKNKGQVYPYQMTYTSKEKVNPAETKSITSEELVDLGIKVLLGKNSDLEILDIPEPILDAISDPENNQDVISETIDLPVEPEVEIIEDEIAPDKAVNDIKNLRIKEDNTELEQSFIKPWPNSTTGQTEEDSDHPLKVRLYNAMSHLQKLGSFAIKIVKDHPDFKLYTNKEERTGIVAVVMMKRRDSWVAMPFDDNGNFDQSAESILYGNSNALVLPLNKTAYYEDRLNEKIALHSKLTGKSLKESQQYFKESKEKFEEIRAQEEVDILIEDVQISNGIIKKEPKVYKTLAEREFDESVILTVDKVGKFYKGAILLDGIPVFPVMEETDKFKAALINLKQIRIKLASLDRASFQYSALETEYLKLANVLSLSTHSKQGFHVFVKDKVVKIKLPEGYVEIKNITEEQINNLKIEPQRRVIREQWLQKQGGKFVNIEVLDDTGNIVEVSGKDYLFNSLTTSIVPIEGKVRLKNRYLYFDWNQQAFPNKFPDKKNVFNRDTLEDFITKSILSQVPREKLDVTIKRVPTGTYYKNGTLYVGEEFFSYPREVQLDKITEELLHHLTVKEIKNYPELVKEIESIIGLLQDWVKTNKDSLSSQQLRNILYSMYGVEKPTKETPLNIAEFIARSISDTDTMKALREINYKGKSLFDKIVDLFRDIVKRISDKLGFPIDETALSRMVEINYKLAFNPESLLETPSLSKTPEITQSSLPDYFPQNEGTTEGDDDLFGAFGTNPYSLDKDSLKDPVTRARIVEAIDGELVYWITSQDLNPKSEGQPSFTVKFLYGKANMMQVGLGLYNKLKALKRDVIETPSDQFLEFMSDKDNFNLAFQAWLKDSKLVTENDNITIFDEEGEFTVSQDFDDDNREEANNEGKQKTDFGREPGKETYFEVAEKEVRAFIMATVGRYKDDSNRVQIRHGYYGRPLLSDYSNLFRLVFQEVSGSQTMEEVVSKLRSSKKDVPEFKEIADRLENITKWKPASLEKSTFIAAFLKVAEMVIFPYKVTTIDRVENKNTVTQITTTLFDKFLNVWSQGMLTVYNTLRLKSSEKNNKLLTVFSKENDTLFINFKTLSGLFGEINDSTLLNLIGINLSPGAIIELKELGEYDEFIYYVKEGIKKLSETKEKTDTPIEDLTKDNPKTGFQGLKRRFNKIADVEGKYSTILTSSSYRTVDNQLQQAAIQTSSATNILVGLNKATHTSQLKDELNKLNPAKSITAKYSLLLRSLFNFTPSNPEGSATGVTLELGFVGGLRETIVTGSKFEIDPQTGEEIRVPEIGTEANPTTSLNGRSWILMDFLNLLKDGFKEFMRTETSTSAYYYKVSSWYRSTTEKTNLPIMGWNKSEQVRFVDYLVNYIKGEVEAYNWLKNEKDWKPDVTTDLPVFGSILGDLAEEVKTKEIKGDLYFKVADKIISFINEEISAYKQILLQEGINLWKEIQRDSELLKYVEDKQNPIDELISVYVANNFIINYEQSKVFDGEVRFFKAWHKRAKVLFSHGKVMSTDSGVLEYLEQTKEKTLTHALGGKYEVSNKISTSVINDDNEDSIFIDDIIEGIIQSRKLKGETLSKEEEASIRKAYSELNVADGAGMCSIDFYRHHMISIGNWDENQEKGFEYEVETMKKKLGLEYDQSKIDVEHSWYFPTIKSNQRGPLAEIEGKEVTGIYPEITDKFSLQPLLPSGLKEGSLGWYLAIHMAKNDIKYVKYVSGTKTNPGMNKEDIVDPYGRDREPTDFEIKPLKKVSIWARNLKEQLNTQFKFKTLSIFGTQFRKLILQNLYVNITKANGSAEVIEELKTPVDQYIKSLDKLTQIAKEELLQDLGARIENGYLVFSDFNKVIRILEQEAIKRDENQNVFEALKKAKRIKLSTKLTVDPLPLEATFFKQTLGNILQGLVNKRLVRQKVNGSMLIQVSSSLYAVPKRIRVQELLDKGVPKELVDTVYKKMYGTSGIPFYYMGDKVVKAGCAISLDGPFKSLLKLEYQGEKLNREKLNSLIEQGRLARILKEEGETYDEAVLEFYEKLSKSINFIAYRIPTQGMNSIEAFEIVEFLDPGHAGIIILPAEIVAKAGSDFDIDKLPTIFPYISNGEYVTDDLKDKLEQELKQELKDAKSTTKELVSILKEIQQQQRKEDELSPVEIDESFEGKKKEVWSEFKTFEKEIQKKIEKLAKLEKAIEQNKVLESSLEIVTHPYNFEYLVTPNTDEVPLSVSNQVIARRGIKRDAKSKGNYSGTDVFKWKSNYMKFLALAAKKLLGVAAVSNTFMTLIQRSRMTMSSTYIKEYKAGKIEISLKSPLFTEEEWNKVSKNNRILLYLPGTTGIKVDGKLKYPIKQEQASQLINSTVDLPSNDYFGYTRINIGNMGALALSINQGLSMDRFILLANQPAVIMFEKLKQLEKGKNVIGLDEHVLQIISAQLGIPFIRKKSKLEYWEYLESKNEPIPGDIQTYLENQIPKDEEINLEYLFNLTSEQKLVQLSLLAAYIKLLDASSGAFKVQQYLGFDTNTDQTPLSAKARLNLRGEIAKDGLFSLTEIDRVRTDSPIQSFQVQEFLINIFEKVLPIQYDESFVDFSMEMRGDVPRDQKERFDRLVSNDFLAAIVQNFGNFGGQDISNVSNSLLKGRFEEQWENFKRGGYKLVAQNPLVQRIQRIPPKETGITNYTVIRGFDFNTLDVNVMIESFKELLNHPDERVKKIFTDFAYLGMAQAWFNKTPFSFTDLIPVEFYSDMIVQAINKYKSLNKEQKELFLKEFSGSFKYNNLRLFNVQGNQFAFKYKDYKLYLKGIEDIESKKVGFEISIDKGGKDKFKAKRATAYIFANFGKDKNIQLYGQPFQVTKQMKGTSSTYTYAQDASKQGIPVNKEIYDQDDVVWVSISGGQQSSKEKFDKTIEELEKAVSVGAAILADSTKYTNSNSYTNKPTSEKGIIDWLLSKGYTEEPIEDGSVSIYRKQEISLSIKEQEPPINIYFSTGENKELSNLAEREFRPSIDYRYYWSVEHAYQTWKSGEFDEVTYKKYTRGNQKISGTKKAKTEGGWNLQIMEDFIRESLEQNPEIKQKLIDTGNAVLTHTQDNTVWKKEFPKILMKIRDSYQEENSDNFLLKEEDFQNPGLSYKEVWKLGTTTYEFWMKGKIIQGGITSNGANLGYGNKAEKTHEDVTKKGTYQKRYDIEFDKQQWEQYKEYYPGSRDLSFFNEGKELIEKENKPSKYELNQMMRTATSRPTTKLVIVTDKVVNNNSTFETIEPNTKPCPMPF
jgi:predicted NAD-dependent protein-ADP-ribosyltransferase YbiA (DUF1768 family)